MRISFSWLQSYFKKELDADRVASVLTGAGLEVESIERPKEFAGTVVVGCVVDVKKHPNADRLSVCQVKTSKTETRTIVCGAPNVAPNQKVIVALPGTKLPNGLEIQKTAIRDVESDGMICAEDELGIGTNHAGIVVLHDDAVVGSHIKASDFADTILEAEVTANRPDWLSMRGVAKELSALLNVKAVFPHDVIKESSQSIARARSIKVQHGAAMQYHLREARGITHAASPAWMVRRLQAVGSASQNPVVDITNYVLFELGQPLHAFDADLIRGKQISVRFAKSKEKIILLDGKSYQLSSDDIVIADASGPIALAGIMGGKSTAVSDKTKNVLIEAAIFPENRIRKTSRRLGAITDASNRFERGINPEAPLEAQNRAASLLVEITGAKMLKGKLSQKMVMAKSTEILASPKKINELLGTSIAPSKMKEYLTRLGMQNRNHKGAISVTVPRSRPDVKAVEDIAEEIARMYGYKKMKPTLPRMLIRASWEDHVFGLMHRIREELMRLGYSETYLPTMYGSEAFTKTTLPSSEHREVENPMDATQKFLRTDLLPGLIGVVEKNRKEEGIVCMFELGQVFWRAMKPGEHEWRLAFARSGEADGAYEQVMNDMVRLFVHALHIDEREVAVGRNIKMRDVRIGNSPVGLLTIRAGKMGSITACECSVTELLKVVKPSGYAPVSKYPVVRRDISLIAPKELDRFTVLRQLYHASSVLARAQLFDVHPQSQETVSLAFHLEFQASDRTLKNSDIDFEMKAIMRALQEKGGLVRS